MNNSKSTNKIFIAVAIILVCVLPWIPPINGSANTPEIITEVNIPDNGVDYIKLSTALDKEISGMVAEIKPIANKAKQVDSFKIINKELKQDIKELKIDNKILKKKLDNILIDTIILRDTIYELDTISKRRKILGIF